MRAGDEALGLIGDGALPSRKPSARKEPYRERNKGRDDSDQGKQGVLAEEQDKGACKKHGI